MEHLKIFHELWSWCDYPSEEGGRKLHIVVLPTVLRKSRVRTGLFFSVYTVRSQGLRDIIWLRALGHVEHLVGLCDSLRNVDFTERMSTSDSES